MENTSISDFIRRLIEKNLKRSIKFSISGWVGFGFVEVFTFIFFHLMGLGNLVSVSSSFIIGVAIEYVINEFWTTKEAGIRVGNYKVFMGRFFKFEVINLGGTGFAIAVQYILFTIFGLEPLIGNLIGSGISFPFNYYLQMKITWGLDIS